MSGGVLNAGVLLLCTGGVVLLRCEMLCKAVRLVRFAGATQMGGNLVELGGRFPFPCY